MSWAGKQTTLTVSPSNLTHAFNYRIQEKCQPRDDAGDDEDGYVDARPLAPPPASDCRTSTTHVALHVDI